MEQTITVKAGERTHIELKGVEPISVDLVRQGNPHFADSTIKVFQFRAYNPLYDNMFKNYGYTHFVEVRAISEEFGGRECAAVYNYAPKEVTRPNPYWPGETSTTPQGWSLGCN